MKVKKYQIKTVQDMVDCTNKDNLDDFLKDLKFLLVTSHTFRDLTDLVGEIKGLPEKMRKIKVDRFIWKDDGEHKINVSLGFKEVIRNEVNDNIADN
ncbi:MAG: hypothetical protein ACTSWL_10400 [Promethearchaeota archaeon]